MAVGQHICFNICDKKMKVFFRRGTDSCKSKQTQQISSAYGSACWYFRHCGWDLGPASSLPECGCLKNCLVGADGEIWLTLRRAP